MKKLLVAAALVLTTTTSPRLLALANTLDIYFIDVEGGQATLVVTPSGQSLLIDAGFPGDGTFSSKPGAVAQARDAQRILVAARAAGLSHIDYLLISHYHADHVGGAMELAQLIPIRTFIDHGSLAKEAETGVAGTKAIYDAYKLLRAKGVHIEPKTGDHLPLKDVDAVVVATNGAAISKPLSGAVRENAACAGSGIAPSEKTENPNSVAVLLQFGHFRFLDVGDLTGAPLFALTCPANVIGEVDLYLVAHHGSRDAADPSLYKTIKPLVTIMSNGPTKGGHKETLDTIRQIPTIDGWQLHRTTNEDAVNAPNDRIANLDVGTNAWIKVSAKDDGSFVVMNGRTGTSKSYKR